MCFQTSDLGELSFHDHLLCGPRVDPYLIWLAQQPWGERCYSLQFTDKKIMVSMFLVLKLKRARDECKFRSWSEPSLCTLTCAFVFSTGGSVMKKGCRKTLKERSRCTRGTRRAREKMQKKKKRHGLTPLWKQHFQPTAYVASCSHLPPCAFSAISLCYLKQMKLKEFKWVVQITQLWSGKKENGRETCFCLGRSLPGGSRHGCLKTPR